MMRLGLLSIILICGVSRQSCGQEALGLTNQERAEKIADALRQANFQGNEISIEFQEGVATLIGIASEANQKNWQLKSPRDLLAWTELKIS